MIKTNGNLFLMKEQGEIAGNYVPCPIFIIARIVPVCKKSFVF